MPKRLTLLIAGIFLFFFFVFFSYLVHKDLLTQFDFNTTVRFQDKIPRRLDDIFSLFSVVGMFTMSLVILVLFFLLLRKWIGLLVSFGLFGMFHVFELYGKTFVEHRPPPEFLLRTKKLVDFEPFHVRAEHSYPSGHSGRALFLSSIFMLFLLSSKRIPRGLKVVIAGAIITYDITMLVSRIYLGEHWATDVIGGAILGLSFGVITYVAATFNIKHLFRFLRRKS